MNPTMTYDSHGHFRRLYSDDGGPYFAGVREDWYYHRNGQATRGLTFDICVDAGSYAVIEERVTNVDAGPDGDYGGVWSKLVDEVDRALKRVRRNDPLNLIEDWDTWRDLWEAEEEESSQ